MFTAAEILSSLLGSAVTPFFLFLSALIMTPSSGISKVLHPKRFIPLITENKSESSVTPFRALSVALAGTLGVGNITGVASALIAGGPGAVFWMWVGAAAVTAVKYSEVVLAVKYRKRDCSGYYGGAMYYISHGLSEILPKKFCCTLASVFAVLCCANSLITGNLIQANAAATIIPGNHRFTAGCILTAAVVLSVIFGTGRIEKITARILPPLTLGYIVLCLVIIFRHRAIVPDIAADIFKSAFSLRSAAGGAVGFTMREAMRFGIMRGIFSNEAGCGTSPTAHASADTASPVHQGCLGIIEVLFDTVLLCTLSAFVFLIADRRYGCLPWGHDADASVVTLESFRYLGNGFGEVFITAAIVLFAYSTIIAQLYYGQIAIKFLSAKKQPQIIFLVISSASVLAGSVIYSPVLWLFADIIIGLMTAVNCMVIILLRKQVRSCLRLLP